MSANINSLGLALALSGVCDHASSAQRKAAWQLRQPSSIERFRRALFNEEARQGHKLSRYGAKRKKRYKAARAVAQ